MAKTDCALPCSAQMIEDRLTLLEALKISDV
jgi:hypothetical protein